jgi:hypothetical protein
LSQVFPVNSNFFASFLGKPDANGKKRTFVERRIPTKEDAVRRLLSEKMEQGKNVFLF